MIGVSFNAGLDVDLGENSRFGVVIDETVRDREPADFWL